MTPQLQIRSTFARVLAWAWLAFAALNLLDLAFGLTGKASHDRTAATLAVLLLLGCGIAYVVGLRPAILADEEGVVVRNPLRDLRAPWRTVKSVEGKDAVVVRWTAADGTEHKTRAWSLQTSPRAQARAEARAAKDNPKVPEASLKGRTATKYAAQQLNEVAERSRPRGRSGDPGKAAAQAAQAVEGERAQGAGTASLTWNKAAVAALGVPVVALVVVLGVGLVG
ncbi:PH domain-containing protein [Actinomadura hibisca]|uniref:PH domain-containing protein n=1 Tax=Actinomadura hibisca TaxID=68565 RepID=UPI00082E6270|nr:PH domain-containing protein [Actinomadura hibisca]